MKYGSPPVEKTIKPRRVFIWLGGAASLLLAVSLAATWSDHPWMETLGIRRFVNVDREANLPTTFSGGILLLSAVLLYLVGIVKRAAADRFWKHWLGLSFVFVFLSLDELASIHEHFNTVGILLQRLGWSGIYEGVFRWPWVISGCVAVIIFGVTFQRFVRSLPRRTAGLFVLSAVVFVMGAVGLEMIGGIATDLVESGSVTISTTRLLFHLEEALEMYGIVLFIYAILDYASPIVLRTDGEKQTIGVSIDWPGDADNGL